MLTTLPTLAKLFKISFDVWLSPSVRDVWQSVIHFTDGGDLPRLPAIFIGNDKCLVHFQDIEYHCDNVLGQAMMNRWTFVELEQKMHLYGKAGYHFEVFMSAGNFFIIILLTTSNGSNKYRESGKSRLTKK